MSLTYKIWCYLEGDNTAFRVEVPSDDFIDELRNLIKVAKTNTFKEVEASALILSKVRHFSDISDDHQCNEWPLLVRRSMFPSMTRYGTKSLLNDINPHS